MARYVNDVHLHCLLASLLLTNCTDVATWEASVLPGFKEIRNGDLVRVDGETHQFGLTLIKVTAIRILERRSLPPVPLLSSDELASSR